MSGDAYRVDVLGPLRVSDDHGRAALVAAPVAVGFVTLPASPAAASPPPLTWGTTVTIDVRLTADLLDCDGAGLVVGAPGITIDLAGHTTDGAGTGSSIGIDNVAGHDHVGVIRGTIREFAFGLDLLETTGNWLDRPTLAANGVGVIVERAGVERTVLERNEVVGNAEHGMLIEGPGNTVTRNRAVANGGIGIAALDGTIDGGNRASGNLGGNRTGVACR